MKKYCKILAIIILTLTIYGCSAKECEKIIVVIDTENPPFGFTKNGEIVGLDIDIAKEIAKELDCDVEVIIMPFSDALLTIQKGEADILAASAVKTAERELIMNFSTPYYNSKQIILKKSDNASLMSVKDINSNTRVGVQRGTVGHMFAEDDLECTIFSFSTIDEEIDTLNNNKIDCIIIDYEVASYIMAQENGLEIIDEALFEYGVSFIIQKDNYKLLEVTNSVIDRLIEKNKIEEFILAYDN